MVCKRRLAISPKAIGMRWNKAAIKNGIKIMAVPSMVKMEKTRSKKGVCMLLNQLIRLIWPINVPNKKKTTDTLPNMVST